MITFEDFHRLLGAEFSAQTPGGPVPLRLTECVLTGPNGDTDSFSLTFTSGPDMPIGQDSYQLSAPGFGPELVFLVPISRTAAGAQYQAVFHRLPT